MMMIKITILLAWIRCWINGGVACDLRRLDLLCDVTTVKNGSLCRITTHEDKTFAPISSGRHWYFHHGMVASLVSCHGVVMKITPTPWYTPLQWIPRSQTLFFVTTYHDARPVLYLAWAVPSATVMLVCLKEREPKPLNNTLKLKRNGYDHFAENIFKGFFSMKIIVIWFKFHWSSQVNKSLPEHNSFHRLICAVSIKRRRLTSIGIPTTKIRRSRDLLIFIMGIPIRRKTVFILRRGPGLRVFINIHNSK